MPQSTAETAPNWGIVALARNWGRRPEGSFDGLFTIGLGSAASYEVASEVLTMTLVNDGTLTFK